MKDTNIFEQVYITCFKLGQEQITLRFFMSDAGRARSQEPIYTVLFVNSSKTIFPKLKNFKA